ncbi:hypothetical protein KEM52_001876, partial [Ascosphaera acerosa]
MQPPASRSSPAACTAIRDALQSPSKCTAEIVDDLSALLGTHLTAVDAAEGARTRAKRSLRAQQLTRTTAARSPETRQGVTQGLKGIGLSAREQLKLATDAFNLASKALSDAARSAATQAAAGSPRSRERSPLKPSSANARTRERPLAATKLPKGPALSNSQSGITELSTCARVALHALLALQPAQKGHSLNESLEQAFTVLIGRLLGLQLLDAAEAELVGQGRRLRYFLTGHLERGTPSASDLQQLLRLDKSPHASELANLVIAFQQHVLRLIILRKRPSDLQEIHHVLIPSQMDSPAQVIVAAQRAKLLTTDRAIQHLQLLSQMMQSLSSTVIKATSTDEWSSSSRAVEALQLQTAMLEVRSLAWTLSGHQCDEAKELWEPLARYFSLFNKRSGQLDESAVQDVIQAYQRLDMTLGKGGYSLSVSTQSTAASTVFMVLAQKAQSAGCLAQAMTYYREAATTIPADRPILMATCQSRIASLRLDSLPTQTGASLQDLNDALATLPQLLTRQLRGSPAELDELVVESARLKKTAMKRLRTARLVDSDDRQQLPQSLFEYVCSFVQLLSRYTGQPSKTSLQAGNADGTNALLQDRVTKFRGVISSAIDSIIVLGKVALARRDDAIWMTVSSCLPECLTLATQISLTTPGVHNSLPTELARLANLFWARYLNLKEDSAALAQQISTLDQCVATLQRCSLPERSRGHLGAKFERLASLRADNNQPQAAIAALRASIQEYVEAGALEAAANDARTVPVHRILKGPEGRGPLIHRAMSHLTKLSHELGIEALTPEQTTTMAAEGQALLLESQLLTLLDLISASTTQDLMTPLGLILRLLMELYPADQYPIRRARVCLQAIRFALSTPGTIDETLFQAVVQESEGILTSSIGHGQDEGLAAFKLDIWTSLHLCCALCFGHLTKSTLEHVVQGWVDIAQECTSWQDVLARLDDPDAWIAQCQSIINYIEQIFEAHVTEVGEARFRDRTRWERLAVDATRLESHSCLIVGDVESAVLHAKAALRLSNRIWARLDRYAKHPGTGKVDLNCSTTSSDRSESGSTQDAQAKPNNLSTSFYRDGCAYWEHFSSHFAVVSHLSQVSSRFGLYLDTIYYADQARGAATALDATYHQTLADAFLSQQYITSGEAGRKGLTISEITQAIERLDVDQDLLAMYGGLFAEHISTQSGPTASKSPNVDGMQAATAQLEALTIAERQTDLVQQLCDQLPLLEIASAEADHGVEADFTQPQSDSHTVNDDTRLHVHGELMRAEVRSLLRNGEVDQASRTLDQARRYFTDDDKLSGDKMELIITRVQSNAEPFVLRLPLRRGDSGETGDEDVFGFAEGKAEIAELIKLANQSAHDTRARSGDREAKKAWWANRQFLDDRMRDFLENVETLWLGGFRGVFYPQTDDRQLLQSFASAFEKILAKHLPSRRQQRGGGRQAHLTMSSAVLDLFLHLNHSAMQQSTDDFVMDLLYFVVDLLQFHGEINAYDEIDFDQMVVEVMDTISAVAGRGRDTMRHQHTILVLDKELHAIPWESLRFLRGRAISRAPSLQSVLDRLGPSDSCLDRTNVSYILNPSGDLESTQAKFGNVLSAMPAWTGLIGKEPSEAAFKAMLEDRDVVLYFGHGSGA